MEEKQSNAKKIDINYAINNAFYTEPGANREMWLCVGGLEIQ